MNEEKHNLFTEQEKSNAARYGTVLINIHSRLMIEGYFLKGGRIWNIFKAGAPLCEAVWED